MRVATVGRRLVDYLDDVAETWIGYSFPPPWRAIEQSNWKSDERSAYCQRCGDSVGEGEATDTGCATCRAGAELDGGIADGVIRLGIFTDELRDWIHAVKFGRWTEMGEELGRRLGDAVNSAHVIKASDAIVVPMPMPWQRRMFRGVDHSHVIAKAVARQLRLPLVNILARGNYTPQVSLPPSIRKRSGSHGLRVRNRWLWDNWIHLMKEARRNESSRRNRAKALEGVQIVLVDDVRTTGATLKAATRLLRTLKPDKIVCAVVAVSDSRARRARKKQTRLNNAETSLKLATPLVNIDSRAAEQMSSAQPSGVESPP